MRFFQAVCWTFALAMTAAFGLPSSAKAAPLTIAPEVSACASNCLLQHVDDDDDDGSSKKRGDRDNDDDDDDDDDGAKERR